MRFATALMTAALTLGLTAPAAADEWVDGYMRNDGSYVAPHWRSEPNRHRFDNYSSEGNRNPYTGQRGYKRHEFSNPPRYNRGRRESFDTDYGYDSW